MVEAKGIEPSDSNLARITRNPITAPMLVLTLSNRMLSSISTATLFVVTIQYLDQTYVRRVRPRHSIEAPLLPRSAVLQTACSGLSFAHSIIGGVTEGTIPADFRIASAVTTP